MRICTAILIIISTVAMIACTKGGKLTGINGDVYVVNAEASSKQLVPAIDTSFTGTLSGLYDYQGNIFTCTISWTELWQDSNKDTITSVSFYGPAAAMSNGVLVRSLPFVNTNKTGSINIGLAGGKGFVEKERTDLLAGSYYYTIDTKRFPNGIIRGQLSLIKK